MANPVWQGSTGSAGDDWNVGANWSTGIVPQPGDHVSVTSATSFGTGPVLSGGTANIGSIEVGDKPFVGFGGPAVLDFRKSTVTVTGDFIDNGNVFVDGDPADAGSVVTIGGTLTVTSPVQGFNIGNSTQSAGTTVSAAALINTGQINIAGNASPLELAQLDIASVAGMAGNAGVLTGDFNLGGDALLDFQGGGLIDTISGFVQLESANAFIATGSATTANSALDSDLTVAPGGGLVLQDNLVTVQSLTIAGTVNVDVNRFGATGSTLDDLGGLTITSPGTLAIGLLGMSAGTSLVSAGGSLVNAGIITLSGNVAGDGRATLDVGTNAGFGTAGAVSGNVSLAGLSLIDFAGGGIDTIAAGASLALDGPDAFLAVGAGTSANSALTGLTAVDGNFTLLDGAQVTISAGLAIGGDGIHFATVDVDFSGSGGSVLNVGGALTVNSLGSLTIGSAPSVVSASSLSNAAQVNVFAGGLEIGGTLSNTGNIAIGNRDIVSAATISAAALSNTGVLILAGGTGQAALDIGSAAPAAWTGSASLTGSALMEFASGSIGTIAANAELLLAGAGARVADAGDTGSSSALSGLSGNAGGIFLVENGAAVTTSAGVDFTNQAGSVGGPSGDRIGLDDLGGGGTGGSSLTIGGTLINTGNIFLGNTGLAVGTTLTAAAITGAGSLNIFGNTFNTAQGTVNITGAAPAAWGGNATLNFDALLEFGGTTGIAAIGSGANITLNGSKARVALANDTTSNTALTGLGSNAGTFRVANGAAVATGQAFVNTSGALLAVDDGGSLAAGGSSLSIGGVLTNSGTVTIGVGSLTAPTSVGAAGLANTGTLTISGGSQTNLAVLSLGGGAANTGSVTIGRFATLNDGIDAYDQQAGTTLVAGALDAGVTEITGGILEIASGGTVNGPIGFAATSGGQLKIDAANSAGMPTQTISGMVPGDTIDLAGVSFVSGATVGLQPGNLLQVSDGGSTFNLQLDPLQVFPGYGRFTVSQDANGNTLVSEVPPLPPRQSPAVLNDFGWQQGWGSADNPRMLADINQDGTSDYVGFGFNAAFIAYGGTFSDGQGHNGPGFAPAVASVNDFGTNEGYSAQVQRGAADAGVGAGDIIYGQGFAGVFWYEATGATQQTDAAGNAYQQLQYQDTPNFYGNFGSQEGWSPANGFQILKTTHSDATASILGFGDSGIVVGPDAFAPGATANDSFVLDFQGGASATTNAGNNFGWNQQNDIRTFTDAGGGQLDLNHDGIADFVGMGPQGLEFAFGNDAGPNGSYQLGALTQAQIGPVDLGDDQGWNDQSTLRYVVADPQTGFDDILAFGYAGVYVTMGQDPATHGGQPFGQLNLAMNDFGSAQGWSVDQTPRLVGDVNGDGIPDIVGFGFSNTFVALGSHDRNGNLQFAIDPNLTIGDFGSSQGWSSASPNLTVRALGQAPGTTGLAATQDNLVLSGAFNTQTWQFV